MPYLPSLSPTASLLDVFNAFPEPSRLLIELHEMLRRGPSPFTVLERELIAAYVSGLNHCRYCYGVHTATAERLGARVGLVSCLVESVELGEAPENMQSVLRYAQKLTRDPASITRSDVEAIFMSGWDEIAVFHAAAITALSNLMNRLVEGLGIELNPGLHRSRRGTPGGARLSAFDRDDARQVTSTAPQATDLNGNVRAAAAVHRRPLRAWLP